MSEVDIMTEDQNTKNNDSDEKSKSGFSDDLPKLEDALQRLYIKTNASGRNKFRQQWPDVATYLFGETLIQYDNEGTTNLAHRSELEEHAMERRLHLLQKIEDAKEKSVEAGVLNLDYIKEIVNHFGPKLSTHIYGASIVERFAPNVYTPPQNKLDEEAKTSPAEQPENTETAQELDDVKPIETPPLSENTEPAAIKTDITHPQPDVEMDNTAQENETERPKEQDKTDHQHVQRMTFGAKGAQEEPKKADDKVEPPTDSENLDKETPHEAATPAPTLPIKGFLSAQFGLVCK